MSFHTYTTRTTPAQRHLPPTVAAPFIAAGFDLLWFDGPTHLADHCEGRNLPPQLVQPITSPALLAPLYNHDTDTLLPTAPSGAPMLHADAYTVLISPGAVLAVDFPDFISVNDHYEMHCVDGPAQTWRDGTELFYVHGWAVPDALILNADAREDLIYACPDRDLRRVLIDTFLSN